MELSGFEIEFSDNTTAYVEFKPGVLERVGPLFYCQSLDTPPRRLLLGTMSPDHEMELEEWAVETIYNMIKGEVDDNGHVNVEFAAIDEHAAVYRTWPTSRNSNEAGDEGSASDTDPCREPTPPPS